MSTGPAVGGGRPGGGGTVPLPCLDEGGRSRLLTVEDTRASLLVAAKDGGPLCLVAACLVAACLVAPCSVGRGSRRRPVLEGDGQGTGKAGPAAAPVRFHRKSSGTSDTTVPVLRTASGPSRPVDIGFGVAGGSKCTTHGTSSMWMPRATTSVPTRAAGPATGEGGQGPGSLGLAPVAVYGCGIHPGRPELAGHPVGGLLGSAEHEGPAVLGNELRAVTLTRSGRGVRQNRWVTSAERFGSASIWYRVGWFWYWRLMASTAEPSVAEEHQKLAVGRGLVDQPADRLDEAHVHHPVGLIEHHGAHVAEGQSPRAIRSSRRPGQATTMSTPRCRARRWPV